jgi:tRNA(adenine34) deaminase
MKEKFGRTCILNFFMLQWKKSSNCKIGEKSAHKSRKKGDHPMPESCCTKEAEETEEKDISYMKIALEQAKLALALGEVPVGAVIVRDEKIIAQGYNRRECDKNALRHAEIIAIEEACTVLHGWRLPRCTLYVTMEPCPMCAGAILNARINRVVYGCPDPKAGSLDSVLKISEYPFNHKFEISSGVCETECRTLLQSFFSLLRQKKKSLKPDTSQPNEQNEPDENTALPNDSLSRK